MSGTGRGKRGFSLIELAIVAGIVGLSIAFMVPQLLRSRDAARRLTCAAKMKTITAAVIQFESVYGALPPGGWLAEQQNCQSQGLGSSFDCYPIDAAHGRDGPNFSWLVLTLPFYGEQALFDQFDFSVPVFGQPNDPQTVSPQVLQCPGGVPSAPDYDGSGASSPARNTGPYGKGNFSSAISPSHVDHQLFFQGALGGFVPGESIGQPLRAIRDGLGATMVVTEVRKGLFEWDHRGVWTLPWPGSAVLAADLHHQLQPGQSYSQLQLIRQYIPDPTYTSAQFPNNRNNDLGDTLFECRQLQVVGIGMPCTSMAFMSAAPRSNHGNGVNAATLDCRVHHLSNDIDNVVYANLIYTRDGKVHGFKDVDDDPPPSVGAGPGGL